MKSLAALVAFLVAVAVFVVMGQANDQSAAGQAADGAGRCVQHRGGNDCQAQSQPGSPAPSVVVPPASSLFNAEPPQADLPSAQSSSPGATAQADLPSSQPHWPAAPASTPPGSTAPAATPNQSTVPAVTPTTTSAPPSQPTGVQPDGVPSALVGSLVLNDSAAALWNSWDHTSLAGADCDTPGTVAVSGGELDLTTDGTFGNCAEISSKAAYRYGVFEARIWVQAASNGLIANWPGFWMVGKNWPVDGEIDGFEGLGGYDNASFHYGTGNSHLTKRDTALKPGWNVVDIVWKPQMLAVYYNGQKFVEWDSSVITSQPMVILFDTTTGTYGYTTGQPSTLLVDYLRVWTAA